MARPLGEGVGVGGPDARAARPTDGLTARDIARSIRNGEHFTANGVTGEQVIGFFMNMGRNIDVRFANRQDGSPGGVWFEGNRMHMTPFSAGFEYRKAGVTLPVTINVVNRSSVTGKIENGGVVSYRNDDNIGSIRPARSIPEVTLDIGSGIAGAAAARGVRPFIEGIALDAVKNPHISAGDGFTAEIYRMLDEEAMAAAMADGTPEDKARKTVRTKFEYERGKTPSLVDVRFIIKPNGVTVNASPTQDAADKIAALVG